MAQSVPVKLLKDLLNETDEFAVENVRSGQGSSFGSSIHVYDTATGELKQIGAAAGNAVLSTGVGSAHAEGLIGNREQFLVTYGATYEDTRTVAGFKDCHTSCSRHR